MIKTLRAAGLTGLLMAFALPAAAQWPDFPTRNVPRTADGEPDLQAPAPRTTSGHIDFTGLWAAGRGFGGRGRGGRGAGQGPGGAGNAEASDSPPVWRTGLNGCRTETAS